MVCPSTATSASAGDTSANAESAKAALKNASPARRSSPSLPNARPALKKWCAADRKSPCWAESFPNAHSFSGGANTLDFACRFSCSRICPSERSAAWARYVIRPSFQPAVGREYGFTYAAHAVLRSYQASTLGSSPSSAFRANLARESRYTTTAMLLNTFLRAYLTLER